MSEAEDAKQRRHPRGFGPCDWSCGRRATITLRAENGLWYRACGTCYRELGTTGSASRARTIQGGET